MVCDSTRAVSEVVSLILIIVLVAALTAFIIIAVFGYTDLLVQPDLRPFTRDIPNSPVAYYGFDEQEGAVTKDLSGNRNDANLTNANWMTSALWRMHRYPSNSWMGFNGLNAYLSAPDRPTLDPTGDLTVEAWERWSVSPYPLPAAQQQAVIITKGNADSVYQYRLWHDYSSTQNPRFRFSIRVGTTVRQRYSITLAKKDTWYYVVGTWNRTTGRMSIFVNGIRESSATYATAALTTTANRLTVGARYNTNGITLSRFFPGQIDEVAVYNRCLSDAEVMERYRKYTT